MTLERQPVRLLAISSDLASEFREEFRLLRLEVEGGTEDEEIRETIGALVTDVRLNPSSRAAWVHARYRRRSAGAWPD